MGMRGFDFGRLNDFGQRLGGGETEEMTFPTPKIRGVAGQLSHKVGTAPQDNGLGNQCEPVAQKVEQGNELAALFGVKFFGAVNKDNDRFVFAGQLQILEASLIGKFGQTTHQVGIFYTNLIAEQINIIGFQATPEIIDQPRPQVKIITLGNNYPPQITHTQHCQQHTDFIGKP